MTDDQLNNDLSEENNQSDEQMNEQPVEESVAAPDDQIETDAPTESDDSVADVIDNSERSTDDLSSESADDVASAEPDEQPQQDEDDAAADEMSIPAASFDLLIMTHASQAMLAMGFMPDPTTGEMATNLKLAGHHVDMLGIIDEKTKGNLTEAEAAMLENSLHQLRMAFVQANSETA